MEKKKKTKKTHLSWTASVRRQPFMSSLESSDLAYAFLSLEISVSRMDMRAPPASPSPLSTAPAAEDEEGGEKVGILVPVLAFPGML